MIKLINKKTRQVESLKPDDALMNLKLDGQNWLPLDGEDYFIRSGGTDAGPEFQVVDGSKLYQVLGDTSGEVITSDQYAVESSLRAEYSAGGQFLKSVLGEALFLGLNKDKGLPDDPLSRQIELRRRQLFGKAETAGSVVGSIVPFLAGGAGGLVRSGAKMGAKSLVKRGAKVAGALPSAQVFKVASKAGEKARSFAKGMGAGKKTQALAGALGSGTAFAGIEAGVAGIRESKTVKRQNEFQKTSDTMKSVLGEGLTKAGETFVGVSAWTAGIFGAGKVAGLGVKGVQKGLGVTGKFIGDSFGPGALRKTFFGTEPGARGQKSLELLKKSHFIKGKPNINTEIGKRDVLKQTSDFLENRGILMADGKDRLTKDEVLSSLNQRMEKVGSDIGNYRDILGKLVDKNDDLKSSFVVSSLRVLNKLINDVSPVEKKTLLKPYVKTLKDLGDSILGIKKGKYQLKRYNEMMTTLARKAKYAKRETKELEIDKAYRKAYSVLSKTEDDAFKLLSKNRKEFKFPETIKDIKNLKESKDFYSDLINVQDVLNRAMPTGTQFLFNFHTIGSRDTIFGMLGFFLGGMPGAVAGGFLSKAVQSTKATGYRHLQFARQIESMQTWIKKSRSVGGVKSILMPKIKELPAISGASQLNIPGISNLFFGKSFYNMQQFSEHLDALPEHQKYVVNDPISPVIEDFGGRDNVVSYVAKMASLKRDIVRRMPQATFDEKGKKTYPKAEVNAWLDTINQGINPIGFMSAVQSKKLTQEGYNFFATHYPDWLSEWNINFMSGWREGNIEFDFYKNFLDNQNTMVSDFVFNFLDKDFKGNMPAPPRRQLRGFSPTISDSIAGGMA